MTPHQRTATPTLHERDQPQGRFAAPYSNETVQAQLTVQESATKTSCGAQTRVKGDRFFSPSQTGSRVLPTPCSYALLEGEALLCPGICRRSSLTPQGPSACVHAPPDVRPFVERSLNPRSFLDVPADLARRRRRRRQEWAILRIDKDVGTAAGAHSRHRPLTGPSRVDFECRRAFAAQGQAGDHQSGCRSAPVRIAGESQQATVEEPGRR